MTVISAQKAVEFFEAKLNFTTGPVELNELLKSDENINIIDVRKSEDYEKGHIPGAISLPEEQWTTFSGLSKDRVNVVYCYSHVCLLAARAAKYFAEHDFPVMELQGGFEAWQQHNLPVEK
ncbi:MAG: rhodanese-like domain-containing protein [Sedimentisphaerales bacterium]